MSKLETIDAAVNFIAELNNLAAATAAGFIPFSKCGTENSDDWDGKIIYLDDPDDETRCISKLDVLADVVIAAEHHDAVSSYGEILSEICGDRVDVQVELPADGEDGAPYVTVSIVGTGTEIIVEDGRWYAA